MSSRSRWNRPCRCSASTQVRPCADTAAAALRKGARQPYLNRARSGSRRRGVCGCLELCSRRPGCHRRRRRQGLPVAGAARGARARRPFRGGPLVEEGARCLGAGDCRRTKRCSNRADRSQRLGAFSEVHGCGPRCLRPQPGAPDLGGAWGATLQGCAGELARVQRRGYAPGVRRPGRYVSSSFASRRQQPCRGWPCPMLGAAQGASSCGTLPQAGASTAWRGLATLWNGLPGTLAAMLCSPAARTSLHGCGTRRRAPACRRGSLAVPRVRARACMCICRHVMHAVTARPGLDRRLVGMGAARCSQGTTGL